MLFSGVIDMHIFSFSENRMRGVTVLPGTAKDCSAGRSRFVLRREKVESCLCVGACILVIYSIGKLILGHS